MIPAANNMGQGLMRVSAVPDHRSNAGENKTTITNQVQYRRDEDEAPGVI